MSGIVLTGLLADLRAREIRLLHEMGDVLARLSPDGEADRDRLRDVAADLRDMFLLVVVVGEFNAGKSTFVNALLGETLLPTGITPTTEAIELIRQGEQVTRKPRQRADGVREWTHPDTGGPGVVLVDTPGTGSVFKQHEETARRFLHRSDLVIFLLSAKRAFADTDRLYLELIRDYGKKVVIIVNQVDLLDGRERSEVRRFVQTQVEARLDLKPLLFMVSAQGALTGQPDNGMDAVRAYLRDIFERVPPAQQKLQAQLDFADRLLSRHEGVLQEQLDLIGRNRADTTQIQRELEAQAAGLNEQLHTASGEVARILSGVQERGEAFIERNFSVRQFRRGMDQDAMQQEFEGEVIARALDQIEDLSNDYVNSLVDSNRRYWQGIIARLQRLDDMLREGVRGVDGSVYAEQRLALQEAIAIADAEIDAYSHAEMLTVMQERFQTNLTGLGASAGVGALGALAAVLGIATPGALTLHAFALLGTVIGIPVAVGGGYFAWRYWRRLRQDVKDDFSEQVGLIERGYQQAIADLTNRERSRLLQYGRQILEPVFSHFAALVETTEQDLAALHDLQAEAAQLREQIAAVPVEPAGAAEDSQGEA